MAKHNTFWISCSATSVDQAATHTWFLLLHFTINQIVTYIWAQWLEIFPEEKLLPLKLFWKSLDTPDDERFNLRHFIFIDSKYSQTFDRIHHNYFCWRVIYLIKTSIWLICNVYTRVDCIVTYRSHESYQPLWRVESHDSYCWVLCDIKFCKRFCKSTSLIIEFIPSPMVFLSITL